MPSLFSERISEASFMLSVSLDGDEVDILVDTKFLGITPVYSGKDPNIDIVAVPGLGSHAFGTWKGDSHEMWLRDFLPKEPVLKDRLRVLIFGYDSALQKNSSTNSFGDYARNMLCVLNVFRSHEKERNRPLIFVCHCLGGILVKTVLCHAVDGSHGDRAILQSCVGIFFFGVPNKGLDNANMCRW
ncbi:hypothetical protein FPQ18DRAFT_60296 [Pyronema domesticum]|nr:hypothetical protein FPQ18DRAFT_60296 [Pyronema domesticum]